MDVGYQPWSRFDYEAGAQAFAKGDPMIPVLVFAAVVCGACIYMVLRGAESASNANRELIGQMVQERTDWSAERLRMMTFFQAREAELLNRIKPETSQFPVHGTENMVQAVLPDDDDAYWASDAVSPDVRKLMEDAAQNGLHESDGA